MTQNFRRRRNIEIKMRGHEMECCENEDGQRQRGRNIGGRTRGKGELERQEETERNTEAQ